MKLNVINEKNVSEIYSQISQSLLILELNYESLQCMQHAIMQLLN